MNFNKLLLKTNILNCFGLVFSIFLALKKRLQSKFYNFLKVFINIYIHFSIKRKSKDIGQNNNMSGTSS